jgi:prepilin-type N-terminal cleavage/methylation domain-containing protein
MKKHLAKGFTLIELLVVIAIVGILSSVVLASLNTARAKGADAAIKGNLAGIRAQAGIVYDANNNSFATACSDATISSAIDSAKHAAGIDLVTTNNDINTAGAAGTATCHATQNSWAVEVPLKTDPTSFFCVNSASIAVETAGSTLDVGQTDCQ